MRAAWLLRLVLVWSARPPGFVTGAGRFPPRAIVAIGRSILVIVWALLSDTEGQFSRSGPLAGAADDLAMTSRR
jgi:hypothetical protein